MLDFYKILIHKWFKLSDFRCQYPANWAEAEREDYTRQEDHCDSRPILVAQSNQQKALVICAYLCAVTLELGSPAGSFAKIAARIENVMTKLPAPNTSGFLRPTRSSTRVMKLIVEFRGYDTTGPNDNIQKVGDRSNGTVYPWNELFRQNDKRKFKVHLPLYKKSSTSYNT